VEVRDSALVEKAVLTASGAKGVITPGKDSVQVIIGLSVPAVAEAVSDTLA
jgi:phosphotransferase system IIB component